MNIGLVRGCDYIANQVIQNRLFFFCVFSQFKCVLQIKLNYVSYKIKTNPFNLLIIRQTSHIYLNMLYHITDRSYRNWLKE